MSKELAKEKYRGPEHALQGPHPVEGTRVIHRDFQLTSELLWLNGTAQYLRWQSGVMAAALSPMVEVVAEAERSSQHSRQWPRMSLNSTTITHNPPELLLNAADNARCRRQASRRDSR